MCVDVEGECRDIVGGVRRLGALWGEHHLMFCDSEVMTYFALEGSDEVFVFDSLDN